MIAKYPSLGLNAGSIAAIFDPPQITRRPTLVSSGSLDVLEEDNMVRDNAALMMDPAEFDEDYYVIDEPPAPALPAREDQPDCVAREPLLHLASVPAPRLEVYWTVPIELDLDWDD
jgi:hypothetical protein